MVSRIKKSYTHELRPRETITSLIPLYFTGCGQLKGQSNSFSLMDQNYKEGQEREKNMQSYLEEC